MSANMKTRHLTLRIYLSHISDGTLSPSSIFYLPPQPQAKLLFEGRSSLPVAGSSPSRVGRVCVSVVLLFYISIYLWAVQSPRKLIMVGVRFSVPFKCLGTDHCVHALC